MTDPILMTSREKELQNALRFERIEAALETITEDLKQNTESTKELVDAWKGAKWLVGVAKLSAGLLIAWAAASAAWHKMFD